MDRTYAIKKIVEDRRCRHEEIQARLGAVSAVLAALESLKDRSASHQQRLHDDVKVCSLLRDLDAKAEEAIGRTGKLVEELRRLKKRTGRETLNIGVVGKPKQGKSTFLQALTGLEEAIIPTGKDFVTGACSYLRHDPAVAPGDAYAVITPYSRREFMDEVLAPFCKKFHLVLDAPDDLPGLVLPDEAGLTETEKFELERLRGLKADYNQYKDLLGQESRKIPKHEIRKYVAQCDESTAVKYTNWYAVKHAEIHCCFPQDDIGDVTICDTPGLGDFTPGAQTALLEKLGMDMDVAFFLKRPQGKETIEPADTEFYDVIKAANPLFAVQDWTYMLLNCPAADPVSSTFEKNLNTKLTTRLPVMQVDAKDKQAVSHGFDTILQDIVEQIPRLDAKLMACYEERMKEVRKTLADVVKAARCVFASATGPVAGIAVDADVEAVLNQLLIEINACRKELREGGLGTLAPEVESIIRDMRNNPPELSYNELDAVQPPKWYADGKDMLRSRFIREFANVDVPMQKLVDTVRDRLQGILCGAGRLSFASPDSGSAGFWQDLRDLLSRELGDESVPFCQAIDNVTAMKLNFRAFILPRLKEITDGLSNAPMPKDSLFANYALSGQDDIKVAANKLRSVWSCAVSTVDELFDPEEGNLQDIYSTPAAALDAMLDEFWLLWNLHGGEKHARSVWRNFYHSHAREVWPEKYDGDASLVAIARSWNAAVDSLEASAGKLR